MNLKDDGVIASILSIFTAFVWINVNPSVGAFYTVGVLFYLMPLLAKKKDWFVEIYRNNKTVLKGIFIALGALFLWVFISSILTQYLQPQLEIGFYDFFKNIRSETNVPVLSTDPVLKFLTYGISIPGIESFFFLSFMLMLLCRVFKVPLMWHNPKSRYFKMMLLICIIIAISASLFHVTARLVSSFAMILDFIFFFISALLVFRYRHLLEAMLFHALTNSLVLIIGGFQ